MVQNIVEAFEQIQHLVNEYDYECFELYTDSKKDEFLYFQDSLEQYFLFDIANS